MKPLRAEWVMSLRRCPLMVRSMRICVPTSSKSHMSPGVYWKYQFMLPVSGSHDTTLLVNRLSPGRSLASIIGTGLPTPHKVWLVSGSYVPVTQTAPPPVCQALVLSFQVSLPGSPGAGMVYLRHRSLPVAASSAAIQSRAPPSPPEAPIMILSLIGRGAPVIVIFSASDTFVSHTTLLEILSVAITRAGALAGEMTKLPHNAAPRLATCRSCLGSMRQTMRPASPAVASIL